MKAALHSVIDELKRLKQEGASHVYVSEEAIATLKASATPQPDPVAEAEATIKSIPSNIRSATAEDFQKILEEKPKSRAAAMAVEESAPAQLPAFTLPEGDKQTRWNALREIVMNCPACAKHVRPGYNLVFGHGNIDADIFFCGEAPGGEEEEQGLPFVGRAGQLLTKMIKAMGIDREQVYITNIMNWRPEMPTRVGNRPPTAEEMAYCLPYLKAQVEIVQPKMIVALGATACKGLLGANAFRSLRQIKGQWQDFQGTPVMPTYHPSYLLRNDSHRDKRMAWEDYLKVMERAGIPISEKQRNYFL